MTAITDPLAPTLERLQYLEQLQYIEVLNQAIVIGAKTGHLISVQFSLSLAMRQDSRALRKLVKSMIQTMRVTKMEIDRDDELTDLLLKHQTAAQRMIQFCDEALRFQGSIGARWMIRWSRRLLIASHTDLYWSRTAIIQYNDEVMEDEDAHWAKEADAVLDRIERGEEKVIPFEQWEARHGLGG